MTDPESLAIGAENHLLSDDEALLHGLRLLLSEIVSEWSERAVTLSREEQEVLQKEIHETCQVLDDLTGSSAQRPEH